VSPQHRKPGAFGEAFEWKGWNTKKIRGKKQGWRLNGKGGWIFEIWKTGLMKVGFFFGVTLGWKWREHVLCKEWCRCLEKWDINFKLWTDWKGWVSKACLFSKMSIHDITVDWWEWTFDVHICTDVFYFHFWCRRPMHLLLAIPSCSLCYQIPLKSCQQVFFQDVTKHHSWWAFWSDISVKYGGILNFQFSQFNQPIIQSTSPRINPVNEGTSQLIDQVIKKRVWLSTESRI